MQKKMEEDPLFLQRLWISDEKMFVCFKTSTRARVWTLQDAPLMARVRQCAKSHAKRGAMCWLAINAELGTTKVFWLDPKLTINGTLYEKLLTEYFHPAAIQTWRHTGVRAIFQQDNAGAHTGKKIKEGYFARMAGATGEAGGFDLLDWPARSPDLSPIEHYWAWLERSRDKDFQTIDELKDWVQAKVASDEGQEMAKLLMSKFTKRLDAVIETGGLPIEALKYIEVESDAASPQNLREKPQYVLQ
jgi:hypothetical protein